MSSENAGYPRGMYLLWGLVGLAILLGGFFIFQHILAPQPELEGPPGLDTGLWRFISTPLDQADGHIIISPEGDVAVIDAGLPGNVYRMVRLLDYLGVKRIETMVWTHPHLDHIGGAQTLIDNFEIGKIWDSGFYHPIETYRNLLEEVDRRNIPYHQVKRGENREFLPGHYVEILNPADRAYREPNPASIAFVFDMDGVRVLSTGDAYSAQENEWVREGLLGEIEILSVGHHGSRSSTSRILLEHTKPEVAIISAPPEGESRYGHPHGDVLLRLRNQGVKIMQTGELGYIEVIVDPAAPGEYEMLTYPFEALFHSYKPAISQTIFSLPALGSRAEQKLRWEGARNNSYRIGADSIELEAGDDSQLWYTNTTAPQLFVNSDLPDNWLLEAKVQFPLEYGREAGLLLREEAGRGWLHWGPTGEGNTTRLMVYDGRDIETVVDAGGVFTHLGLAYENGRLIPLIKGEKSANWRRLNPVRMKLSGNLKAGIYAKSWAGRGDYSAIFTDFILSELD